ncbi:HEXXH motif domain-containing protein [Streptomyces purpurascens]|uniref:HEXXH motif domain-containing protein n=1 Tax=Streptomyces purpurascens TaxID=1924 RepID=A0ABZ1MMU6_STREF
MHWARHELTWDAIDALARGSAGPEVVRLLRRSERSRTLLVLRAILDEAERNPETQGDLTSLHAAWDLLDRVQRTAPGVLDAVLAYPYVSSWAGHTLRRLRGRAAEPSPLWAHLGHLGSVAAAAAIRAGLDIRLSVPARMGMVSLPTLGTAYIPDTSGMPTTPWSLAGIYSSAGRTEISVGQATVVLPDDPTEDAPGWWGLRRVDIRTRPGQQALSLHLDDLDPYRGLNSPLPPDRVGTVQVRRWKHLLTEAWSIVCAHLPEQAGTLSAALDALVPLPPQGRFLVSSASSGEAFGAVLMSLPRDPAALAATLVHESQHILLGGLIHLVALHDNAPEPRFYAPWRDDPRPISGIIQGIYAFFGVARFWRALAGTSDERLRRTAAFEYTRWHTPTCRALDMLLKDPGLTDAGRRFFEGMGTQLLSWQDEPLPSDVTLAATTVAKDHETHWRLAYLRPDSELVKGIARTFQTDLDGLQESSLSPGRSRADTTLTEPTIPWPQTRADLIRCSVGEGMTDADFRTLEAEASPGDLALAAGRHFASQHAYRAELAASPNSASAWVGFALAWASAHPGPGPALLLRRPALVQAVYRLLREAGEQPEPDVLATWMATRWPGLASIHPCPRTAMA